MSLMFPPRCSYLLSLALGTLLSWSLSALVARAEFVKIDDFDAKTPGEIVGQDGWTGTTGMADVVADPVNALNQVLAFETSSGQIRRPMLIPNGQSHMVFFRFRFGDQQNYSIGPSHLSSPYQYSDFGPEMGMANQSNGLRVYDGVTNKYVDVATLVQSNWYNVWMWVDNSADTYQLWVNSTPGGSAQAGDKLGDVFGFRATGNSDLIRFYINASGGSGEPNGPVYLDDIYLETTSGLVNLLNPVPEPSSLVLASLGVFGLLVLCRKRVR